MFRSRRLVRRIAFLLSALMLLQMLVPAGIVSGSHTGDPSDSVSPYSPAETRSPYLALKTTNLFPLLAGETLDVEVFLNTYTTTADALGNPTPTAGNSVRAVSFVLKYDPSELELITSAGTPVVPVFNTPVAWGSVGDAITPNSTDFPQVFTGGSYISMTADGLYATVHLSIGTNTGAPQVSTSPGIDLGIADLRFRVKSPLPFSPTTIEIQFLTDLYGIETEAIDETRVEDPNQPDVNQNILRNYSCLWCSLTTDYQLEVFDFFLSAQQTLDVPFITTLQLQRRSSPDTFNVPTRIQFLEVRGTDGIGVRTFGSVPPAATPTVVATTMASSNYEMNRAELNYTIQNLRSGTYNFVVKPRTALSQATGNVFWSSTPTPVLSSQYSGPFKEGDYNGDDKIDTVDFSGLVLEFGQSTGYDFFSGVALGDADFNKDGVVTIRDFALLAVNFGQAGITLTPTPSPTP